jgi:hypothetical protein
MRHASYYVLRVHVSQSASTFTRRQLGVWIVVNRRLHSQPCAVPVACVKAIYSPAVPDCLCNGDLSKIIQDAGASGLLRSRNRGDD